MNIDQITHTIYLLVIGALLGGYFVGIFANPKARVALRRDLALLAEVLLPTRTAAAATITPAEGWRANVTGKRSYRGRHHLAVPYSEHIDLSWQPAHLHAMGVLP